jgi:hypothetical protein
MSRRPSAQFLGSLRDEEDCGGGKNPEVGEFSLGDGGEALALIVELVPGRSRSLPREEYPRDGPASFRACRKTLKIGGV